MKQNAVIADPYRTVVILEGLTSCVNVASCCPTGIAAALTGSVAIGASVVVTQSIHDGTLVVELIGAGAAVYRSRNRKALLLKSDTYKYPLAAE
jgi:hypothetical protein